MNASGFSTDYLGIGPRAHELTSGRALVKLNVRTSGKHDQSASDLLEDIDDIQNSPEDIVVVPPKKMTKRKKDTIIEIESDEEEADWILGSSNNNVDTSIKSNKKFKSHDNDYSKPKPMLHAPSYLGESKARNELDDSYLETPMDIDGEHIFDNIDAPSKPKGKLPKKPQTTDKSQKKLPMRNAYALVESEEEEDNFRVDGGVEPVPRVSPFREGPLSAQTATAAPASNIDTIALEVSEEKKLVLTRSQRQEFQNWLFEYRKRWPMYWNYMDNAVVSNIVKELPTTKEELSKIPKFGQMKTIRFGDHILATIWAFLDSHHLLEYFPESLRTRPTISECPTWLDPCSEAAEVARTNSPSAGTTIAPIAPSSSTDSPAHEGGKWYQAGVATGQKNSASKSSGVPSFFNADAQPTPATANNNMYSPTDHARNGYSNMRPIPEETESQVIDMTTPPGGYHTHSLNQQGYQPLNNKSNGLSGHKLSYDALRVNALNGTDASPSLSMHRQPLQAVPEPHIVSASINGNNNAASSSFSSATGVVLKSADSVYGQKNNPPPKQVYSMEY